MPNHISNTSWLSSKFYQSISPQVQSPQFGLKWFSGKFKTNHQASHSSSSSHKQQVYFMIPLKTSPYPLRHQIIEVVSTVTISDISQDRKYICRIVAAEDSFIIPQLIGCQTYIQENYSIFSELQRLYKMYLTKIVYVINLHVQNFSKVHNKESQHMTVLILHQCSMKSYKTIYSTHASQSPLSRRKEKPQNR